MAPHSTENTHPFISPFCTPPAAVMTSTPSSAPRPLVPGVYVPTPCFFLPNEDIDAVTIAAHSVRLARAGVSGITVQGSNGEAVHLTHEERSVVTATTRQALDAAGYVNMPLIVGCGAQSTRETTLLCQHAAAAGGDYALVLPPSYYKASYDRQALLSYFNTVAENSPIPLLLYNYPGAASGTDLDSDFLIELAAHPNIRGAKLTCGNVGKIARLAAATSALTPFSRKRASSSQSFVVLAGSADFFLPALAVNGSGTLAGLANIVPKSCVELMHAYEEGETDKARELQAVLARADWAIQKGGVVGTKYALQHAYGYGGFARSPLPRWTAKEIRANSDTLEEALELEREL